MATNIAPNNGVWHYLGDLGWTQYDPHTSANIENAYKDNRAVYNFNLNSTISYIIDFNRMEQIRNEYGTVRTIKRSIPPSLHYAPYPTPPLPKLTTTSAPIIIHNVPYNAIPLLSPAIKPHKKSKNKHAPTATATSQTQTIPQAQIVHSKYKKVVTEFDEFFLKNTEMKLISELKEEEMCPICITSIKEPADIDVPSNIKNFPKDDICALKFCSHLFHNICIISMLNAAQKDKQCSNYLSCPVCQTIHGMKTGDQPLSGTMDIREDAIPLPGHPGYGTITVTYNFNHCSNKQGMQYNSNGFPRVCFIPASHEGRKLLKLLQIAFNRRLIFTIGTSITSGTPNCVVWNNIHHKTERNSNSSGHGYPDPNYIKNATLELAVQGVSEKDIK